MTALATEVRFSPLGYLGGVTGGAGAGLAGGLGELPTAWAFPGPPTCCTTGSLWSTGVNGGKGACGSV